jgi:catechol 2,3-dioxygenase-like lactoylglutathione lyase family enzyme
VRSQLEQQQAREGSKVLGIHHVGITVSRLERSLEFYVGLLGLSVIGQSEPENVDSIVGITGAHVRIADLDAGHDQLIELLEYASSGGERAAQGPDTVGSCHISLQVVELRSVLSRLEDAGFTAFGEPTALSGGVWEGCTVVYVRDPDNVILELIERSTG